MPKQLILCDCLGSQKIDGEALAKASGIACSRVHSALCTDEITSAAKLIEGGEAIVACQQEMRRFEDLAEEIGAPVPGFVDIRDRAGWSDDEAPKLAKMAALVAEARIEVGAAKTFDLESAGICLVVGAPELAMPAARDLADHLSVTVLLSPDVADAAAYEADDRFAIVFGRIAGATGSLGRFSVRIDDFCEFVPGGRGQRKLTERRDGALSECDVILDFSGDVAMFSSPHKRDGYLRADPGSPRDVAKTVFDASHLIGTFEKTLYVRLQADLCAHSRASKKGCSKCLDNCPTGAITPDGDHVAINTAICAGCGTCSAICPSGAISYDAPPAASIFKRIGVLASTYRSVAQEAPRLLVHDGEHGSQLISACARHDRGLPADVIPIEVAALASFGHAEMLAALAAGFSGVSILLSPDTEGAPLEREAELAVAISREDAIALLDIADPSALPDALSTDGQPIALDKPISPVGSRRQITRLAAKVLNPGSDILDLPENSPYGAVVVDKEACTLCLACVSLCPSGALGDNPDAPQLRFQENACLQCGICKSVCPESAISLQPRLNLADNALSHQVLHEEEPFACIECGKPFGVKSTVMKITEKLAGKHSMFANPDAVRLIQMCDDCRVGAQFHSENNPLAGGERPRVRTTDDYLSKRRDH